MITLARFLITSILLLLLSCNNEPSLQKYFVENTENKDFMAVDLTPKMLNIKSDKLSVSQKEALASFEKINVLAFKANDKNKVQFETEKKKIVNILKDKKYQELMKFGSGSAGAQISFVGEDEHIEEFVIFGNKKENGFAVVRVLGKDMNPTYIMEMMSILKDSKIDMEQLKPLQELLK
ncbi:DUF4252 domain-containing protein [Flavobacterium sp.]|uniref:DUF4252 domain-containing protein n=1 Tax=Flavobacterium sp. TaxID=239 RepID=UPI002610A937|nr:DUF4252 domain-containing protein [Flavobacterium sp.]